MKARGMRSQNSRNFISRALGGRRNTWSAWAKTQARFWLLAARAAISRGKLDRTLSPELVNDGGSGAWIDVSNPFLLVIFHPTTTEYGGERQQMEELLEALERLETQTILLWPNIDAGADHISKAIRVFRDRVKPTWLRFLTNLSPENYLRVLANAGCAIGNSSSFVRDASFFGTPVVLVGNRQDGREIDEHVMPVAPVAAEVVASGPDCSLSTVHTRRARFMGTGTSPSALLRRLRPSPHTSRSGYTTFETDWERQRSIAHCPPGILQRRRIPKWNQQCVFSEL